MLREGQVFSFSRYPPAGLKIEQDARCLMIDVVVQPTQGCNLNCGYCYLPNRDSHLRMHEEVAVALAESVRDLEEGVHLIWHGGEPLACGSSHLGTLLRSFEDLRVVGRVRHSLQTNATLVDNTWCDLFQEFGINVGVSIDGPREFNKNRVSWSGRESFSEAKRGIELLANRGVPFSVIVVVNESSLLAAERIYDFVLSLGCRSVGFNIVEQEGANTHISPDDTRVRSFWGSLFDAWRARPEVKVREFGNALAWMSAVADFDLDTSFSLKLLPTVANSGDVVLLSPELIGARSDLHSNFVVGNITRETLRSILGRALKVSYVDEFRRGVRACRNECEYFSFCRGGQASNKFFEHGSFEVTETAYCRNAKIRLVDGVLDSIDTNAWALEGRIDG